MQTQEAGHGSNGSALAPVSQGIIAKTSETASTAVAAQAQAAVQARYTVALARPRNIDQVRVALLKECRRPYFAEVARYHKPVGQGVEGPSIRFAEAAARCMGNILVETPTVYDDTEKRIVRVVGTDLETNMTYQKDVTVTKTVERRQAKGEVLGTRLGSGGQTLYIIAADDDAILNKENALVSKAMRTVLLRLIPGDLIDESMDQVAATLRDKAAQDPDAARRRVVDGFAAIGIQPNDLVAYLRHGLEKLTPAELVHLRSLYQAIKDGEATWLEVMGNQATEAPAEGKTQTQRTAELLDQRRTTTAKEEPKQEPAMKPAESPAVAAPSPAPQQAATKTSGKRGQAPGVATSAAQDEPPPHGDKDA